MAKFTFNLDQVNQPTPASIKLIYRVLMFASSMWAFGFEPRFPGISEAAKHSIDAWLLIGNFGIYQFCQFFGFKAPDKIEPAKVDQPQLNQPPSPTL
jgi:hypothetical protein